MYVRASVNLYWVVLLYKTGLFICVCDHIRSLIICYPHPHCKCTNFLLYVLVQLKNLDASCSKSQLHQNPRSYYQRVGTLYCRDGPDMPMLPTNGKLAILQTLLFEAF